MNPKSLYDRLKEIHGKALPETLPDHWRFPVPPVCTAYWTEKDWVAFAAPHNLPKPKEKKPC